MEGRDSMALSQGGMAPGQSSFSAIFQRGRVIQPGGSSSAMPASPLPPPGLHTPAPMKPTSGMTGSISSPANTGQVPYVADMSASGMAPHPVPVGLHMGGVPAPARVEAIFKRKRGRPRKYGPDGSMALALVSHSASASTSSPLQKRGRGRPPGSGRKQQLAALGTAGVGFTPHVITIAGGEDVAMKIMSFSQQGPRAICILSANGAVSNATLRQPATSGGSVTYEGRFEILSLSGSFLPQESNGISSRTGGLSISLSGPDGQVLGGGVAGLLLAAGPVQVVVGSFLSHGKKPKQENPSSSQPGASQDAHVGYRPSNEPIARVLSGSEPYTTTGHGSTAQQPENRSMPTAFHSMGWPGFPSAQQADSRRTTDINVSIPSC